MSALSPELDIPEGPLLDPETDVTDLFRYGYLSRYDSLREGP